MLKLCDVVKKFGVGTVNETTVFDGFDFTVNSGEFISIVGSNGSGKTTLLNLICGSLPLTEGKVLFRDKDITKMPEYNRARFIGRVFQDPSKGTCASLSILENLSLAANKNKPFGLSFAVTRKQIGYFKEQLELLHLGLENKLETKVGSLSGGQRQALALLISTLTPIDLLILDEHTAALDPKSSENVMQLTDRLIREKELTAVMVTHNLRYAVEFGNRICMMHEGKCIIDKSGESKKNIAVPDLLKTFNEISVECGN